MDAYSTTAVAVAFAWLGLVFGISFVEAPLKFRAPNVTLQIGLGIGRIVFRALNAIELLLAVVLLVVVLVGDLADNILARVVGLAALLGIQLVLVRPMLNRRSDAVLAGHVGPRSRVHLIYVGLEVVKLVVLVAIGLAILNAA